MTEPTKLLPCPFCGGPPVPWIGKQWLDGGGPLYPKDLDRRSGTHAEAHVWCHECGARSGNVDMIDALEVGASTILHDEDDMERLIAVAISQWNDRAQKNIALYHAGEKTGHNVYPRADQGKWSE